MLKKTTKIFATLFKGISGILIEIGYALLIISVAFFICLLFTSI